MEQELRGETSTATPVTAPPPSQAGSSKVVPRQPISQKKLLHEDLQLSESSDDD
jgi:hypothetical protein